MREIKFRAWLKKQKQMCRVWDIGFKAWDSGTELNYVNIETDGTEEVLPCEVELMQYTGLKDKNGVEIYEGDIVKYRTDKYYSNTDYIEAVEYSMSYAGFLPFSEYDSDCGIYVEKETVEVIGNLYQNPELLK